MSLVDTWKSRHYPAQFKSRAVPAWRRVPEDDAWSPAPGSQTARKRFPPVYGPDPIEVRRRMRIRATIEELVKEELDAVLGAEKSARVGDARQGYRHGARERMLTTSVPTTLTMPRARLRAADDTTAEWRSETVRRYQRRTTPVDKASLGVYLADTNSAGSRARSRRCSAAGRCRKMRCCGWSLARS